MSNSQAVDRSVNYMIAKRCARCGWFKDAIHFYRNPHLSDDLQSVCIQCCKTERRGRWSKAMRRRIELARERARKTSEAQHA